MSKYMTPDDPQAFLDMPVKEPDKYIQDPVLCPKCKGHGGWHLKLDDFGQGRHFNAACNQCNGWGWVRDGTKNATCLHDFKEVRVSMHVYKNVCQTCGHTNVIDSSD